MDKDTQAQWANKLEARRDALKTVEAQYTMDDHVSGMIHDLEACGIDLSAFKDSYILLPE